MTALEMIREGFSIWVDSALGAKIYTTPIVFTLLFLFGFLATAVLKNLFAPRPDAVSIPETLCAEGREIIDDANTTKLFELESELTATKDRLNRFTETLSTTFAHLSGGIAIFDADKSLYLFNPALSDLLNLDPVWLAKRPSIADFVNMLREKRHLPEKKNFLEWRRLLTDLKDTGQQKSYDDEWVLPDGRVFHVTGQPHPRGAVAFLFEDISMQVAIERQHRAEVSLNQNILNGLSDAVVVVDASGRVTFTNTALGNLFGVTFRESFVSKGIPALRETKLMISDNAEFWLELKAYVAAPKRRSQWEKVLITDDGTKIRADVSTLTDGSALVIFKASARAAEQNPLPIGSAHDPLHFTNLEDTLGQRVISFDHSGFDSDCLDSKDMAKARRILWYLVISAANRCRPGGRIVLSSRANGQFTALSCHVSEMDREKEAQENIAGTLLRSLIDQHGGENAWAFDAAVDPYTVFFKARKQLKLSAQ